MYTEKAIKWNPATGEIAIRTQFSEDSQFANMTWQIATSSRGARNASTAELDAWIDVPIELLIQLAGGN